MITTDELIKRLQNIEDSVKSDRENNKESRKEIIKMIDKLKEDLSDVTSDHNSRLTGIEDLNKRVVQLLEGAFGRDGLTTEVSNHTIQISSLQTKINYIIGIFTGIQIIGFGTIITILLSTYN